MPYRTRRRGSYYRRRPAKPTTWIRNNMIHGGSIPHDDIWEADMLSPIHSDEGILKVAGAYETAPSAVGRTCVRIIGQIWVHWNTAGVAGGVQVDDGAYVGIYQGKWTHDGLEHVFDVPTTPTGIIHNSDPKEGANITDWCYWNYLTPFAMEAEDLGDSHFWGVWRFDVRAKRSLRELGDTMLFCMRPDGDGTQNVADIKVVSSVLLR